MIEKLNRLLDLLIVLAEKQLDVKPGAVAESEAAKAERKLKKTKRAEAPAPAAEATAPAAASELEDQLGLGVSDTGAAAASAKAPEMTEAESAAKIDPITKQFVILCKNDKPEDGKTRAIKMLNTDPRFSVKKLGDLTHPQRLLWIAEMEKGIAAAGAK